MKTTILLLIAACLLAACGAPAATPTPVPTSTPVPTTTPDPCGKAELIKFLDAMNGVSRRFDDAISLAQSTPRMSLSPVIADMQTIRRDTEDLKVPVCVDRAKQALILYMSTMIEGFNQFLAGRAEFVYSKTIDTAKNQQYDYEVIMVGLETIAKKP